MPPLEASTPPVDTAPPANNPSLAKTPARIGPRASSKMSYLVGAVILIAACLFVFRALRKPVSQAGSGAVPVVAVAKVERKDLAQTLTISAEFRAFQQVALHSKVAGYLQTISVDIGDHVKEGQAIAQLDVPELKDDLAKATAALGAGDQDVIRAEAAYNDTHTSTRRLQDVAKQHPKLVAEQDLDTAQARDAAAAGALAMAKQRVLEYTAEASKVRSLIAYATITAPFDGVITKRYADPGALVQAGTSSSSQAPLVDIAEDQRLRLLFPVPESSVALVEVGAPARVTVPSLGKTIEAKVSRLSGKVDRATRTMSTEVDIDNSDRSVKPGMYAAVELAIRESKNAVVVPVQAIAVGEKPKVFAVSTDGVVEERPVKLGLQTPFQSEVTSGLQPGDMVIVGSRSGIQPGQKVSPKLIEVAAE